MGMAVSNALFQAEKAVVSYKHVRSLLFEWLKFRIDVPLGHPLPSSASFCCLAEAIHSGLSMAYLGSDNIGCPRSASQRSKSGTRVSIILTMPAMAPSFVPAE